MRRIALSRRQGGAVIITVALLMLFLLGFIGFAVDFGRLFIVKTELQTAMDACALAAAHELDGQGDALTRARSAGLTAANLNRVNLQSASWDGQGQMTEAGISFRNAGYGLTTSGFAARYAECVHTQPSVQMMLMHAMGAFMSDPALFPDTKTVAARAVATRAPAQSACPLPLALKPKLGGPAPNYGFAVGEWVRLLMAPGAAAGGEIGWANLDGTNSASETEAEMLGYCGTEVGDELGTPGVQASIADAWNFRFGLYRGGASPEVHNPDMSGYSYTALNWPSRFNAFDAPVPPPGAHPTAQNFVTKRQAYANCADTGTRVRGANSCESITGLSLNGFSRMAAAGAAAVGGHRTYGIRSRVAVVPVVDGGNAVIDYACMFMLQPLTIPMADVYLEFRGNASDPGSPCVTAGIPGGSAGPLVPALVR